MSANLATPSEPDLAEAMTALVGRHTEKTFDWDAFPGNRGFAELERAQMRYVGGGGSPKASGPDTLKAQAFTFSLVHKPPGKFAAAHSHEVVEHFLILQGVLTVGWVWGDEVIETKLGPRDMVLNKTGRPHGFRNDGVEPVLMQITVGSGKPEPPVYTCHPKNKPLELARVFGAGEGKVAPLEIDSSDPRHQEFARHVVRYRDRQPVWDPAGFARMVYIGENGAPPQRYRMDMIHLPRGAGVKTYARDVEDVYFVLEGTLTVGWEENGKVVEQKIGTRDLIFNPAGRAHYFRNDGVGDVQFAMVVGSPDRETIAFRAA
ncbi:cupin domain-containing protein [Ferrovibrio sp.]|uniref:cupin domain-containing protein n=1 Tax=Ferrovibrio sp. TaxID=1917215 RepID=UPI002621015D|nr:cupin domain-containing protein [Ferrovibrio sp.]